MYLYHYTYNFFHNNRPGKPLPGHSSFLGLFWALFFVGGEGGTDGLPEGRLHGRARCGRFAGSPSCALVVGVISLCGAWVGNLCWMYKLYPLLGIFVVLRGVFSAEGVF